eukprot:SAG11_NODE_39780_length_221_cov_81.811475_2_plen_21_part_01
MLTECAVAIKTSSLLDIASQL